MHGLIEAILQSYPHKPVTTNSWDDYLRRLAAETFEAKTKFQELKAIHLFANGIVPKVWELPPIL